MKETQESIGTAGGTAERPCTFFSGSDEFRSWLEANHQGADELWMGLYKKHVPDRGLTWEQAVPEALCFGWIDSVSQRIDDDARRQRWTPRRPRSNWSAVNIALVARLTEQGRMHPAGIAAFEKRREELSRVYSYENTDGEITLPPEFTALLEASPVAGSWLAAAPASYRRIALNWVVSAKRENTRRARMASLIEDCEHGRLIKSQRYGTEPGWAGRARTELGLDDTAT